MPRKKTNFSMEKWREFRRDLLKEDKKKLTEASEKDMWWLADGIVRALIGNHKAGLSDITKHQNAIRDYVDEKNFNEIFTYLVKEFRDVLLKAIKKSGR